MKNAVCRRSGQPMSWWEGEEERGEGDLSMVIPLKRLFSERLPALKA
jgi:hypothetical protein